MAITLSYDGQAEQNNPKGLLFKGVFTGVYGVNGVGDLLNLTPSQAAGDGGILDPNNAYNLILTQPPKATHVCVVGENLGGSYVQIKPNAVPTLKNFGVRVFAGNGTELATGVAYGADVLAGSIELEIFIPLQ